MSLDPHSLTSPRPVWPDYFADPFVLKSGKTYWAYGTAPGDPQGRQFPVLRSDDLLHWTHAGHALQPLRDPPAFAYWAPEVAEKDGRFFLYYSASTSRSDEHHRLRVATADCPAGPFIDSGAELLPGHGFTIDAHPFRDPGTGRWYLYFASDYLQDEPHGTGLAVVELADDMLHAVGKPKTVLRATCDWQIYQRNRDYKGKVWRAWHCVEGPFVVHRQSQYWLIYSGGAWNTPNYGIGFAIADHPMGPWHHDAELHARGPTVLRGTNELVGPGHASIVSGPDDKTDWLVYHAWDSAHTARRMHVGRLKWTPTGPVCDTMSAPGKTGKD